MTDPTRGKFIDRQRAAANARDRDIESDKRRRTAVRGVTVQPQPTPQEHNALAPFAVEETDPGMTDYQNLRTGQRQTMREIDSVKDAVTDIQFALTALPGMAENVKLIADTLKADFDRRTAIEVARIAAEAETRKAQLDSGTALALASGTNRNRTIAVVVAAIVTIGGPVVTYLATRPTSPAATSPQKATP